MIEKVRRLAQLLVKARNLKNSEDIIYACVFDYSNPDEFMEKYEVNEYHRDQLLDWIIYDEFYDFYIRDDNIDSFCEWVLEAIEDEDGLPENHLDFSVQQYFQWMYQKLLCQSPQLALVDVGYNDSDNIQMLIVHESDTAEIKQLCEDLEIGYKKLESTGFDF